MQLFRVIGIEWDIDDNDDDGEDTAESLGLPESAYVYAESEDEVTDVLSDELGFCIKSLSIEPVEHAVVFPD